MITPLIKVTCFTFIPQEQFKAYPKQRQDISEELKKEAIQLLQMKASKKMVREHLSRLTGKNIAMKDVHNMAAKAKRIQEEELNIQNYEVNNEGKFIFKLTKIILFILFVWLF